MPAIFENNLETTVGAPTTAGESIIAVPDESIFPDWKNDEWTPLFLINPPVVDAAGNVTQAEEFEIVHAFSKFNNRIEVRRGQEGSVAKDFPTGAIISARITKAAWASLIKDGDSSITVLRGVNFGVDSGTPSVIETAIDGIGEYSNYLEANVLINWSNDDALNGGVTTLKINSLPAVPVILPDGTDLPSNSISPFVEAHMRYDSVRGKFVLMNANALADLTRLGFTKAVEPGLTGDDDTSYVTPNGVRTIIEAKDAPLLSSQWQSLGSGTDGSPLITTTGSFTCGFDYNFINLTINDGAVLNASGTGVLVCRVRGTLTIGGRVNGPRSRVVSEDCCVPYLGGRGGQGWRARNHLDPTAFAPSSEYGGVNLGDRPPDRVIDMAMRSNVPFQSFQGGQGAAGYDDPSNTSVPANPGGGGLIFIADKIVLLATAEFHIEGAYAIFQGNDDPETFNSGPSGGGCLVLAYKDSIEGEALPKYFYRAPDDELNTQSITVPITTPGFTDVAAYEAGPGWHRAVKIE